MLLHLDVDAFFAGVELAADTRLRGKPIAAGGDKRGVISSANYEPRHHPLARRRSAGHRQRV